MKSKRVILEELNSAIDDMDMESITLGLQALSSVEEDPVQPQDALVFSRRIQELNREGDVMKTTKKTVRIAMIAAAIMVMGVSAYAAIALNWFSFVSGDKFVTMRTTESMTQQQAQGLVERDDNASVPEHAAEPSVVKELPMLTFDSAEQAAAEMDMRLVLPPAIGDMRLEGASGQRLNFGDGHENRTVWLSYTDDAGRMLEVTTSREIIPPGSAITSYTESDIDEGSAGKYKSKSGVEFTTFRESDATGSKTAFIATTMIGEYDYALVFLGFEERDIRSIIDSADLSVYQQ